MAETTETKKPVYKATEYVVVDYPFYDGVKLHEVGSHVVWAGPPGKALHPVSGPKRKSQTDAPLFPDPMAGRGDGVIEKAAKPSDPVVLVQ